VDHCNLNCKGCTAFSPVAEEKFMDVNMFERDCERLAELTGGKIELIDLLGGEPLLHPKINEPPQSKLCGIFKAGLFRNGGSFARKFIKTSGLIPNTFMLKLFSAAASCGVLNQIFE
jgi:hypothetical protein